MGMTMKIEGFEEFDHDIRKAIAEFPSIVKQAMDKSTRHIKNKVQDKIVSEKITFKGGLQQSVHAEVQSPFKGEVFVGKKYGIFVEKGTRPHWPPREPIEKWAALKLGKPGLGFVISRKIARVGTKAHPYFVPAVEASTYSVTKIFEKTADALVAAMAGG